MTLVTKGRRVYNWFPCLQYLAFNAPTVGRTTRIECHDDDEPLKGHVRNPKGCLRTPSSPLPRPPFVPVVAALCLLASLFVFFLSCCTFFPALLSFFLFVCWLPVCLIASFFLFSFDFFSVLVDANHMLSLLPSLPPSLSDSLCPDMTHGDFKNHPHLSSPSLSPPPSSD